ncbi:MAG: DUF4388 domain-containing protein [Candidatus Melainabacteria bacterium]|uniref:DUF4388 domain-containing protein n=1 Tax=Candidatus Obscuribacter phosphatis TaxID=1906157 RepID=A0A8J7TNW0_9BACT|nr:DUF4388 domain-containing protein [Candidatus Obscuribacter phosphatis]MCA0313184.1 DUF4388 domain-containing protein [Candidatus Melainabacteria bacterium]
MNDDLTKHASFVGMVYDQTLPVREPLCAAFQVDGDTVVTTAHALILYRELLPALRLRFPTSGKEYSVRSISFHPDLDLKELTARAKQALAAPYPALPLQQNNVAILKLQEASGDVSEEIAREVVYSFERFQPSRDGGLAGSLSELELPLVLQTITNARKEGTLSLMDERFRTIGQIYCQGGKIKQVFYRGLLNESAFYQIINHRLAGFFHFATDEVPDWSAGAEISRPPDMLLIEALRRMDELEKLTAIVGGPSSLFSKRQEQPNYEILPPDCRDACRIVWPFIDGGTPLGSLWQLCGLDDFAIYSTLQELIKTRQISYYEAPFVRESEKRPMQLGLDTPLSPNDMVTALWVEDASMAPLLRRGVLLGSAKDQNPSHVVHNIGLPEEASGCPVFKDGSVIGMHCGAISKDAQVQDSAALGQMIWIESVVQCLRNAGEGELVKKLTATDISKPGTGKLAGIREVVRIQCPKCGRSSMELANFCKGCGQRLIDELEPKGKKRPSARASQTRMPAARASQLRLPAAGVVGAPAVVVQPAPLPIISSLLTTALVMGLTWAGAQALPKPNVIPNMGLSFPDIPRVRVEMLEWVSDAAAPTCQRHKSPNNEVFSGNEKFSLEVTADTPSYVYCLYRGNSGSVALIYPVIEAQDQLLEKGKSINIALGGEASQDEKGKAFQAFTFDKTAGTERFIFVASSQKARFLNDQSIYEPFVKHALDLLSTDDYIDGVETNVDKLGPRFFADPGTSRVGLSGLMGDSVYLRLMELKHKATQ